MVVAFPSNDFGGQEPKSDSELKTYCADEMKVTFDTYGKIPVKGDDAHPLYKFLKENPNKEIAGPVEWNFQKYLIGRDGKPLAKFGTKTLPEDPKVTEAVEKALASKG